MSTTTMEQKHLTRVLDGLFGCEASAKTIEDCQEIKEPRALATYFDTEDNLEFIIVTELSIANSLGAALTMIPPGGAEEATKSGSVPEHIEPNLYEVLNICSAAFEEVENRRILVRELFTPGKELPTEVSEKLETANCILQIEYELERYQPGLISILKVN